MPRSATTKPVRPSEAHKIAYRPMVPPSVGDPMPATLGEMHDIADHYGLLLPVAISDDGGLNISWTAGMVRTPGNDILLTLAGSGTCTDDAVNHLKWVSGSGLTLGTTDATHNAEVAVGHIACQNGDIWEVHTEPLVKVVLTDIQHGLEEVFPLTVASGCLVSEDAAGNDLDVTVSTGIYFHDLHDEHAITSFDTRTANTLIRCFIDGAGPETWDFTADGAESEIDVGNWNNGTNRVVTNNGKYYKGLFIVSESNIFWLYAQEEHNTLAQALDGALPSTPPGLGNFPRSVAYVYRHGDTAFEAATSDRWMDVRPLITGSAGAVPITDHGNLVGLQDVADHLYAFLIDGTRALTGEMNAGLHTIGFTQQTVTYASGTTTVDWKLSNKAKMTFGAGNITTFAFTNPSNPCNLMLRIQQDGTGSRVVSAWDADIIWAGGVIPTLSTGANAIDALSFYWDGVNYLGQAALDFS